MSDREYDDELRAEWRAAGGAIHGPNVETVTMPERQYFAFRRGLGLAPAALPLAWSREESAAATAEGWDVFDSSQRGLEIERIDDPEDATGETMPPAFASDEQAIGHVYARAQQGSALHQKALLLTLTWMKGFAQNPEGLVEAFNECFQVIYRIANTPADRYANDSAWAHAMHSAAYKAYPRFQDVRAMIAAGNAVPPAAESVLDASLLRAVPPDITPGLAPAAAAPSMAEAVIDLEALAWAQITQAASESTWMPPEYMANDWLSDVCDFLRKGPAAFDVRQVDSQPEIQGGVIRIDGRCYDIETVRTALLGLARDVIVRDTGDDEALEDDPEGMRP